MFPSHIRQQRLKVINHSSTLALYEIIRSFTCLQKHWVKIRIKLSLWRRKKNMLINVMLQHRLVGALQDHAN